MEKKKSQALSMSQAIFGCGLRKHKRGVQYSVGTYTFTLSCMENDGSERGEKLLKCRVSHVPKFLCIFLVETWQIEAKISSVLHIVDQSYPQLLHQIH